jgi:hypothetical protein
MSVAVTAASPLSSPTNASDATPTLMVVTEEEVLLDEEVRSPLRERAMSRSRSGSVKLKKAVF